MRRADAGWSAMLKVVDTHAQIGIIDQIREFNIFFVIFAVLLLTAAC